MISRLWARFKRWANRPATGTGFGGRPFLRESTEKKGWKASTGSPRPPLPKGQGGLPELTTDRTPIVLCPCVLGEWDAGCLFPGSIERNDMQTSFKDEPLETEEVVHCWHMKYYGPIHQDVYKTMTRAQYEAMMRENTWCTHPEAGK